MLISVATRYFNKMTNWLRNFETICSIKLTKDKEASTMRLGNCGAGMRSTQKKAGSDPNPTPAFSSKSLKRNYLMNSRVDVEAAFDAWAKVKDAKMRATQEELKNSLASKPIPNDDEPYMNYIPQSRSHPVISKSSRNAACNFSRDSATSNKEVEALLAARKKKLQPHMAKKRELIRREREKHNAVMTGKALPSKLMENLQKLDTNPLSLVTKRRIRQKKKSKQHSDIHNDKDSKNHRVKMKIKKFPDREQDYECDFEREVDSSQIPPPFETTTTTNTLNNQEEPAQSRIRARTFALGLKATRSTSQPINHKKSPKIGNEGMEELKQFINFESSLLALPAGHQYKHRRKVETVNSSCKAVASLRRRNELLSEV